ncbi:C40 family peptidase [Faecalibacter rhinopitheci]|uniref:C40 family peptidase n=1 Tax=Faecalibacter rhinopitheci TaxID=2779678 RepID=A0A8J7FU67_9FLAO|nr:C40 family peptidase [Faecalibacter rhinopitheci]MBF0597867.1 C40 family peptidase [Faecalibacter rhinopitheci]MBQ0147896.1 C40 family peptidase [Candidatus Onthonaster equi]
MKTSLLGVAALICTMFITSCSSLTPVSEIKEYSSRSFVPQTRVMETQTKLINKRANLEVEPVNVKDESSMLVLNSVLDETNNLFTEFLLKEAETYIGTPYRYGGTTRRGIDCSAFVRSVFESFNMNLPRVSADQAKEGQRISTEEAREGDLVFFATRGGGRVSHVGIVHGRDENGVLKFIHSSTSQGVMVSSLNDSYWGRKFLYAKRVL